MKLKISEDRVKHFHLTEKKVFDLGYYRNKPENDTYVINTPNKLYYYNKVSGNKIIPWKTLDDCIDALLELSEINMLEDIIKKGITISRVTSDNYVVEEYSPEEVYDLANKFVRNMRNPMIADYFDESLYYADDLKTNESYTKYIYALYYDNNYYTIRFKNNNNTVFVRYIIKK